MVRWIIALFITLALGAGVVSAQGTPALDTSTDPLAFTPTGDALWDTYSQALLSELAKGSPEELMCQIHPPDLPRELLDGWAGDFGDDPRYWQLRWWDADRRSVLEDISGPEPVEFLRRARERGAVDATTLMLLYSAELEELNDYWDLYASGQAPDDARFKPETEGGATIYTWYVDQRFKLADELVAACPDESWAWYQRAKVGFEFGRWEQGLADLETGNSAPVNRRPKPFPVSFIYARILDGQGVGSKAAVGLMLQGELASGLPNFIREKDMLRDEFVRLGMGADLIELKPWHGYICRFGSMEGTGGLHWITAYTLHGMLVKYLMVETPEVFSVDQRDALWGLYGRGYKIRTLAAEALDSIDAMNEMTTEMQQIAGSFGITEDEPESPEFLASTEGHEYVMAITCRYLEWQYEDYAREYGKYYPKVRERFEMLGGFNWDDYCWPDGE